MAINRRPPWRDERHAGIDAAGVSAERDRYICRPGQRRSRRAVGAGSTVTSRVGETGPSCAGVQFGLGHAQARTVDLSFGPPAVPARPRHADLGRRGGGSRGGYWTNGARRFSSRPAAQTGTASVHLFYLDKDELPGRRDGDRLWGACTSSRDGETTTLGATYIRGIATPTLRRGSGRDECIQRSRGHGAPATARPICPSRFEYASERNGDGDRRQRVDGEGRL